MNFIIQRPVGEKKFSYIKNVGMKSIKTRGVKVKENYYALLICLVRPYTIDQSLRMMLDGKFSEKRNMTVKKDDVEDMIRMKQQGMTHQAIGEIYGLSEEATYRRIKRYKEKRGIAV